MPTLKYILKEKQMTALEARHEHLIIIKGTGRVGTQVGSEEVQIEEHGKC
jgi:hypothetical protein